MQLSKLNMHVVLTRATCMPKLQFHAPTVCLIELLNNCFSIIESHYMRFQTMWYVQSAKPQISLRIQAVLPEPLLVA